MEKNKRTVETIGMFKAFLDSIGVKKTEDIEKITEQLIQEMEHVEPPKVAFIGLTGAGKSSMLNALFNAGAEVSDVMAGTKVITEYENCKSEYTGSRGTLTFYDMPGLGESIETEEKYCEMYQKIIPEVDVVLCFLAADNRQYAGIQRTLSELKKSIGNKFTEKMLVVINKADAIAPGEHAWNTSLNIPSTEQLANISKKELDVMQKIKAVLPDWDGGIVTCSAMKRYRLETLMNEIMKRVPVERQWQWGDMADVAPYEDLIDQNYISLVKEFMRQNME